MVPSLYWVTPFLSSICCGNILSNFLLSLSGSNFLYVASLGEEKHISFISCPPNCGDLSFRINKRPTGLNSHLSIRDCSLIFWLNLLLYILSLSDQCLRVVKKIFKEIVHFHYNNIYIYPCHSTRTPAPGIMKITIQVDPPWSSLLNAHFVWYTCTPLSRAKHVYTFIPKLPVFWILCIFI